jgi:hypothetical protein
MNDHINKFNTLLQSVEYNRPPEIPELQTASINLSLLQSLDTDWEVWGMAKGNAIRTTPTAELMAEVRALAMRGSSSSSHGQNDTPAAEMKANTAKFGNHGNRGNNGGNSGGKWKKNRGNRKTQPYNKDKSGQGKNNGNGSNSGNGGRRDSWDPNKFCTHHQRNGQTIFECKDAKKEKDGNNGGENEKWNSGNDGSRQSRSESYQPGFSFPSYPSSVNVTLIEANSSTEISTDPDDWIVDSGANAFITPYKSDLRYYVEAKVGQVKGFTGKQTNVIGKGSMTVTDPNGNRLTLHNVCYCPSSQYRILSFMKFRRECRLNFEFTGWESFTFKAANGFEVHGESFNDIMHISLGCQPEINVVTTRRASAEARNSLKRKHDVVDVQTPSDPENGDDNIDELGSSDPEIGKGFSHIANTTSIPTCVLNATNLATYLFPTESLAFTVRACIDDISRQTPSHQDIV